MLREITNEPHPNTVSHITKVDHTNACQVMKTVRSSFMYKILISNPTIVVMETFETTAI